MNLFWTQLDSGLSTIKALLASGGKLYIFYQLPSAEKVATIVDKVTYALEDNGFAVAEVLTKDLDSALAVGIIAKPRHSS